MGRKTNKQRRSQQAQTARERAAIARSVQRRQEQRARAVRILVSVVGAAALIAVVAVIAITHKSTSNDPSGDRVAAQPAIVQDVESISASTASTVGKGSANAVVKAAKATDPPLTDGGKPEVLYVGGEFCPFCAAERWSLVQALSRFGTFKGLSEIRSATSDLNLATFSFYKASYTSKYLSFVGVENEDRDQKQLQKLTSAQTKVFGEYTTGFPFLDFGGKFVQLNAGYDPTVIEGKTQQQIASALNTPSSTVAKNIDGEANQLTATICKITNNQPSSVCLTPTITTLQSQIGA